MSPVASGTPSLLEAALAAARAGLAVVPPREDGSKRPSAEWKRYQRECPTEGQLAKWYSGDRTGIGFVCGTVSGNLEVLDFDERATYDAYVEAARGLGLGDLVDRIEAGYLECTPHGVHWPYRCATIAGNTKLAQRPRRPEERRDAKDKTKTLIETRGQGGYIIVAPSHGAVNSDGAYELVRGSVSTIAAITPEERAALHQLARSFDQLTRKPSPERRAPARSPRAGPRPGDEYTARTTWDDVLQPQGWLPVLTREGTTFWRRPGKDQGWSATTNYAGSDLLYVFTSSTAFEPERGYSRFAAYAILNHQGDFSAAAKALGAQGYGTPAALRATVPTDTGRPVIVVTNRPLRDVADDALAVLLAANQPPEIYVRGAWLTRVRVDETGRPLIEPLSEAALRGRLTRIADFMTEREGDEGETIRTHTHPPLNVVRDLLARPAWDGFPALEGIVEAPALRPDGTILDTPGYDPATRLVLHLPPGFIPAPVPAVPTKGDVARALSLIWEAIGELPYADPAAQANALGLLLTPVVRTAIAGPVPLALIDKPRAGTGASLFADVVALVATGRDASMTVAPRNEEEWRKRLTAVLLSGATVAVIDNVGERLASDSLAAALTAGDWADRLLGKSEMVRVPNRATWICTGNNIGIGGDLPRRCYLIRLDARTARPWEREGFTHAPLKPWVQERRADLLAALLTLARAWWAAGRPAAKVRTVGSFEAWSETIGGILAYAGVAGFLTNLPEFYERSDDEARQWEGFFRAWLREFGPRAVPVAEVAGRLRQDSPEGLLFRAALPEDLAEALENDKVKTAGFQKRLGKALGKRDGVQFGDYRLDRAGEDSHSGTVLWRVRELQGLRGLAGFSQPHAKRDDHHADVDEEENEKRDTEPEGEWGTRNPPNPANPANAEVSVRASPGDPCPVCGAEAWQPYPAHAPTGRICARCHPSAVYGAGGAAGSAAW